MVAFSPCLYLVLVSMFIAHQAHAETHEIVFTNNCGFGTPLLKENGMTLSTGGPVTINGPLISAIAFLQTGGCGDNGEGCAVLQTTLRNPTSPGEGSITCIVPNGSFSEIISFEYFGGGCDGLGSGCTTPACPLPVSRPFPGNMSCVECQGNNSGVQSK